MFTTQILESNAGQQTLKSGLRQGGHVTAGVRLSWKTTEKVPNRFQGTFQGLSTSLGGDAQVSELPVVVWVRPGYLGPAFAPSGFFSDADEIQAALGATLFRK